ncbi:septum formation family protein [Paramicrobacterium chengjingii]|uniref:Septum formation family protein n=1 Tax=Paramicrobacterium chengjingii TaxID=2769067 RepID=A0ABX6YGK5_9MICO|nr:septum formation family protein [Microbacterium chengjingii]QPZ37744.1 septum formation family protein [Microbacterium chengjingii]
MTPRDDDKHHGEPDPQTGESDLGADWLMSQLDDTGAVNTVDEDEPEPRPAPSDTSEDGSRWSRRRRFRRREQQPDAADAATPPEAADASVTQDADGGAPTRAFDAAVDRAAESPIPPRRTKVDGIFSWGLTPNDAPDPLVEKQAEPQSSSETDAGQVVDGDAIERDEGEPTQAFDPFADRGPEAVSPEEAAIDGRFSSPDAYDRLYDEATLSALGDDDDDDDDDAVDETTAADLPVPKSAVSDEAAPVVPAPIDDAPSPEGDARAEEAVFSEPAEFADDAERAEAEALAEKAGVPLEAETTESPDLGILDLFGGPKRERTPAAAPEAGDEAPITPAPAVTGGTRPSDESETSSRLRALFESTATAPVATNRSTPEAHSEPPRQRPVAAPRGGEGSGGSRGNRPFVLVGLAVVAVLVLGGLFWVGTLIPGMVSASQPEQTESSTPTPTQSIPAEGTLPAGTYAWDQLRGGECLGDYSSPWDEEFTVVDCEGEHDAQLVAVGEMSDAENAAFPGEDELASQIYLKCSDPSVLDLAAAGAYGDVQVQGSYPVTEEQWNDGQRNYYCFVNRSSGDPLTGSLVPAA